MKSIYTIAVTMALLLCVGSVLCAETAEEVLEKNIQAVGGRDRLASIKSMMVESKVILESSMGTLDGTMKIYAKGNNMRKTFLDLGLAEIEQGYDGKAAWVKSQGSVSAAQGPQAETLKITSGVFPILNYKTNGAKYEALGRKKLGDIEVVELKVILPSGRVQSQYYDGKSFLLVQTVAHVSTPQGETDQVITLDNYQEVDGIKIAHKIKQTTGPQSLSMEVKAVKFNVPLEDTEFAMPKAEGAEKK